MEGSGYSLFEELFQNFPGVTIKNLKQDSLSLGRDLNLGPSECKAGLLTTRSRRSMK
jgi:hypothetical protein